MFRHRDETLRVVPVRGAPIARGAARRSYVSRPIEDVLIESLIGWEVAAAIWPTLQPPSTLLKRRPLWERYLFAGALAVVVVFHLDCTARTRCTQT